MIWKNCGLWWDLYMPVSFFLHWIQYNELHIAYQVQIVWNSRWVFAFWFQLNEIQFDFNIGHQSDSEYRKKEKATRKENSRAAVVSLTCNQSVKHPAVRHNLCSALSIYWVHWVHEMVWKTEKIGFFLFS